MSDKTLDCQKYHASEVEITWENCDLRKWLYSSFYRNAFSEEEQNAIKVTTVENDKNEVHGTPGGNTTEDKVYIPSIKEISNTNMDLPANIVSEIIQELLKIRYIRRN